MKRTDFDVAAGLVDRIDKLEAVIFNLEAIKDKKSYTIMAFEGDGLEIRETIVKLNAGEIATEVFIQDILEMYINTLNLELDELRKSFEDLA